MLELAIGHRNAISRILPGSVNEGRVIVTNTVDLPDIHRVLPIRMGTCQPKAEL